MTSIKQTPAPKSRASTTAAKGYAAQSASTPLAPFSFEPRATGPRDVRIEILFCGVCHSDLHLARNEWNMTSYPIVPGHEIVGRVTEVGVEVKKFAPGDLAAVGCMVDSCRTCPDCKEGLEQFCQVGLTLTYNSPEKQTGRMTYGGYSDKVVVDQDFVLRLPDRLDPAGAAPLLCAGISDVLPAPALGGGRRQPGRHRRPRRPWAHGRQAGPRAGCGGDPVHDVPRQGRGRQAAGGRPGGHLP